MLRGLLLQSVDCNLPAMQVESAAHAALMKALWADTAFLAGQGGMDYSLLVGVDSPNGALVVGIIDFLRQVRVILHHDVHTGITSQGLVEWWICCMTNQAPAARVQGMSCLACSTNMCGWDAFIGSMRQARSSDWAKQPRPVSGQGAC